MAKEPLDILTELHIKAAYSAYREMADLLTYIRYHNYDEDTKRIVNEKVDNICDKIKRNFDNSTHEMSNYVRKSNIILNVSIQLLLKKVNVDVENKVLIFLRKDIQDKCFTVMKGGVPSFNSRSREHDAVAMLTQLSKKNIKKAYDIVYRNYFESFNELFNEEFKEKPKPLFYEALQRKNNNDNDYTTTQEFMP